MKNIYEEKRLNPILETLGLIYMAKNFEIVKTDILASLEEMNIDSNQFYKQHLTYLKDYVHEFETVYSVNADEDFFFEYNTEFFLTVIEMATELFESGAGTELLEKQHILSVMSGYLIEEESNGGAALDTLEEWFAALSVSEYSDDTKWRLLELLHNPVEKFQQLFGIYKSNRTAFDYAYQKNKKHLDKLLSDAPAEPSKAIQNIVEELLPETKKIYFTAVAPLIELITPTAVFQGVLADKVVSYQKEMKNAREMLPQVLKLLGDKSKFEILCLLKTQGRYNLEIAEELQLTPATASHHMSMLLSNQMVTVEKKDGKVYYQLNQTTLREIVKCFEDIFL